MAKKAKREEPQPAVLTRDKIKMGIKKLDRRLKELEEFDISSIQERFDAKVQALRAKINDTIADIFGHNTIEYKNYDIWSLDTLPHIMGGGKYPLRTVHESYKKGISEAIVKLKSLKETLQEKYQDFSSSNESVQTDNFWNDIHPKIVSISKSRFESTHYSDAVESALKEVNSCVKGIIRKKTGKEVDGAPLMHLAFSPKDPLIVLDDLSTESGRNVQQGYMEIFAGAMIGIRNPKAHDNIHITEVRTKHFIYLASLLMHKIDERV